MTTLFAFCEIALGPTKFVSMRNDEKFCSIRMQPTVKNTTTESLTTKLLYNYICRFWNKLHSYIKPSIVSLSTSNCSYSMGHQSLCKNYQTLAVKTEIYVIPTECISATCASSINKNVNRASSNRVFIM